MHFHGILCRFKSNSTSRKLSPGFSTTSDKGRRARKWILVKHFRGPARQSDFTFVEEELRGIEKGEFQAKAMFWSVDPYMRAYGHRYKLHRTMPGYQVARVIQSKNRLYPVGTIVTGPYGWRTHTNVDPKKTQATSLLAQDFSPLPVSLALSYAGLTGNTAYFGITEIAQPTPKDTMVISGAGGAVGSHAGQLAKLRGCRVIGICGSRRKCEWLTQELGFDDAINYKAENVRSGIKQRARRGVDIYWDNVGGRISSDVMPCLNQFGKVIVCGAISTYDHDRPPVTPDVQRYIYSKQLNVQGFLVKTFADAWQNGISANLSFLKTGQIKYKEWMTEGFENIPATFIAMMKGVNVGKAVVKSEDEECETVSFIHQRPITRQHLNI